jgi:hypothetical protein
MAAGAMRRAGRARNGSLTIIVLTPLTTIFGPAPQRGPDFVGSRLISLEYFLP